MPVLAPGLLHAARHAGPCPGVPAWASWVGCDALRSLGLVFWLEASASPGFGAARWLAAHGLRRSAGRAPWRPPA
eukprot:2945709-Alexandrium_andersonii.AAC.1